MRNKMRSIAPFFSPTTDNYYQDVQQTEEDLFDIQNDHITYFEIIILVVMVLFITTIMIMAGWSATLLFIDRPEGGCPLGIIADFLINSFT